jgi:hypothetical protein
VDRGCDGGMKCSGPTRRQAASRVMVPVCQVAEARFIRPAQGVMSMPPASPQWLCNRRQFSVAASRHILPCPTLLPPANVHAQENSQLTGPESCCRTACCVLSVIPCIGLGGFTSVAANTSSAVFRFGKLEVSVEHPRASCASQCVMCVHAHQWVYALRCVRLGVCVCIVCRRTAPPFLLDHRWLSAKAGWVSGTGCSFSIFPLLSHVSFYFQRTINSAGLHWLVPCAEVQQQFMGTRTHETSEISAS